MRRLDIEDVLGHVPMPEIDQGAHLLAVLWSVGPVRHEAALMEQDLQPWESRRGIELHPWQADLVLEMSRAYLSEMYAARELSSLAPWPKARNLWKYVQDQKHQKSQEQAAKRSEKEQKNEHRQRHRNPPSR